MLPVLKEQVAVLVEVADVAGVQPAVAERLRRGVGPDELVAFVKERIGSVKAPKQVELWPELPRSRLGKVLKADVRTRLLDHQGPGTP